MGIDWSLRIPRLPLFVKKNQTDFLLTFLSTYVRLYDTWRSMGQERYEGLYPIIISPKTERS